MRRKQAQETQILYEWPVVYTNHAIRIDQQANLLLTMVTNGVSLGINPPEEKTAIQNLRDQSVKYVAAIQKKSDIKTLQPIFDLMLRWYNDIEQRFVDRNFQPMVLIRQSLFYIWQENNKILAASK